MINKREPEKIPHIFRFSLCTIPLLSMSKSAIYKNSTCIKPTENGIKLLPSPIVTAAIPALIESADNTNPRIAASHQSICFDLLKSYVVSISPNNAFRIKLIPIIARTLTPNRLATVVGNMCNIRFPNCKDNHITATDTKPMVNLAVCVIFTPFILYETPTPNASKLNEIEINMTFKSTFSPCPFSVLLLDYVPFNVG